MVESVLGEADVSGCFTKFGIITCIRVMGIGPVGSAIAYCICCARHVQFT